MPERIDSPERIRQGNESMWEAWELGRELLDELGDHAGYGKMSDRAGEDESQAEKLRKLRSMARRITRAELGTICELTAMHGKAWGPTHLVALSRLPRVADRRKLAKTAIREHWGLTELQRQVKRQLGPMNDPTKVGRKRDLDMTDEAAILDQIQGLCLSWIRLAAQLQQDDIESADKIGLELLPNKLREQFLEASTLIAELQKRVGSRLSTRDP